MKKNTPNYPVHLFSVQTNSGYEWVARYPDILGCVGGGDTPEEALAEAKINLEVYLESLDEDDLPYPNISSNEMYSANGKIALRISKDLHTKLKKYAEINRTSVNQICVEAISEKIGVINTVENLKSYIKDAVQPLDNMLSSFTNILKSQRHKVEGARFENTVPTSIKTLRSYNHA